jgi:hypothetical protein
MTDWQTAGQAQSAQMQAKLDVEPLAIGESGGSARIWLIWWIGLVRVERTVLADFSET